MTWAPSKNEGIQELAADYFGRHVSHRLHATPFRRSEKQPKVSPPSFQNFPISSFAQKWGRKLLQRIGSGVGMSSARRVKMPRATSPINRSSLSCCPAVRSFCIVPTTTIRFSQHRQEEEAPLNKNVDGISPEPSRNKRMQLPVTGVSQRNLCCEHFFGSFQAPGVLMPRLD